MTALAYSVNITDLFIKNAKTMQNWLDRENTLLVNPDNSVHSGIYDKEYLVYLL